MFDDWGQTNLIADIVNSAGLLLDIVGVVLLFMFGLPSKVRRETGSYIIWGADASEQEATRKEYRRYQCMSFIALGCLVTGFVLQIVSNFLPGM